MIEGIVFQNPRLRLLRSITLLDDSFPSSRRRAAKDRSSSGSLTPLVIVPECRTAMGHTAKRAPSFERPNFRQELYISDKLCEQRRGIIFSPDEIHRQRQVQIFHWQQDHACGTPPTCSLDDKRHSEPARHKAKHTCRIGHLLNENLEPMNKFDRPYPDFRKIFWS